MIIALLYGWNLVAVLAAGIAFGALGVWWAFADVRRALREERRRDEEIDLTSLWPRRPDLGRMRDRWLPREEDR